MSGEFQFDSIAKIMQTVSVGSVLTFVCADIFSSGLLFYLSTDFLSGYRRGLSAVWS